LKSGASDLSGQVIPIMPKHGSVSPRGRRYSRGSGAHGERHVDCARIRRTAPFGVRFRGRGGVPATRPTDGCAWLGPGPRRGLAAALRARGQPALAHPHRPRARHHARKALQGEAHLDWCCEGSAKPGACGARPVVQRCQ
jgi:hypothetical protein